MNMFCILYHTYLFGIYDSKRVPGSYQNLQIKSGCTCSVLDCLSKRPFGLNTY